MTFNKDALYYFQEATAECEIDNSQGESDIFKIKLRLMRLYKYHHPYRRDEATEIKSVEAPSGVMVGSKAKFNLNLVMDTQITSGRFDTFDDYRPWNKKDMQPIYLTPAPSMQGSMLSCEYFVEIRAEFSSYKLITAPVASQKIFLGRKVSSENQVMQDVSKNEGDNATKEAPQVFNPSLQQDTQH